MDGGGGGVHPRVQRRGFVGLTGEEELLMRGMLKTDSRRGRGGGEKNQAATLTLLKGLAGGLTFLYPFLHIAIMMVSNRAQAEIVEDDDSGVELSMITSRNRDRFVCWYVAVFSELSLFRVA